jgi:hypothetical protein
MIARAEKTTRITLGFLEMPGNFSNGRMNKKNLQRIYGMRYKQEKIRRVS